MKKLIVLLLLIGFNQFLYSQASAPLGNGYVPGKFLGFNASNGVNPLFTRTNNLNRMRLNGGLSTTVSGYNTDKGGFLGLGSPGAFLPGSSVYNYFDANSPLTMLHLNGRRGTFVQTDGYRPWMHTGITFTDNQDFAYFGIRSVGGLNTSPFTNLDITEFVAAWADNDLTNTSVGPDDFVFRFFGSGNGNTSINTSDLVTNGDLDGRHIARFSSTGFFGLGNTFGVNVPGTPANLYTTPKSLMHMSYEFRNGNAFRPYGFMQITYRRPSSQLNDIIGQGELDTDGLRLGIDNTIFTQNGVSHLNAYLRWQEASSFIIQTEDGGAANIVQNERMRITSTGALAQNYGINYLGLQSPSNTTRISISQSGSNPLLRPMSLMHLGFDYGFNISGTNVPTGYRKWMDLGVLTSTGRDHMWVGLRPRNTSTAAVGAFNELMDAVIAWGNDGQNPSAVGPDFMRFIFTSDSLQSPLESPQSKSQDGLETGRFYPGADTTFTYGENEGETLRLYGRFGVGDFTAQGVNEQPTHKLDVVGNGRFRYLPDSLYYADSSVNKLVMVDSNGVLRWIPYSNSNTSFVACSDTSGAGTLQSNVRLNLNKNNIYFQDNDSLGMNHVGIGYICDDVLPGKLSVVQTHPEVVNANTSAGFFENKDLTVQSGSFEFVGVSGKTVSPHNLAASKPKNIGGDFNARGGRENYGVRSYARNNVQNLGGNTTSYGVHTKADSSRFNYGLFAQANGNIGQNYAIYGRSSTNANDYAAYLVGNVLYTGTATQGSDSIFKTNVNEISGALKALSLLSYKSYYYDTVNYPYMNFSNRIQVGLIAQEVNEVFPEFVFDNLAPPVLDNEGNILQDTIRFKSINYNALIPVTAKAVVELSENNSKKTLSDQSIKTNVNNLDNSLDKVLAMRGVTFDWTHGAQDTLSLDSLTHVGFIAQEINTIDPLLTYMDDKDLMHVDYQKVIPVAVEAIEELNNKLDEKDSIINSLNDRLTQLENCLSGILPHLCQMSQSAIETNTPITQEAVRAQLAVKLNNKDAIILDQNVPNPFAEQTVINFSIPATVVKAQLHFYSAEGKLMQSVDVKDRGLGSITVFGSDLSSGTYTYSLVADGIVVATKRMVKE